MDIQVRICLWICVETQAIWAEYHLDNSLVKDTFYLLFMFYHLSYLFRKYYLNHLLSNFNLYYFIYFFCFSNRFITSSLYLSLLSINYHHNLLKSLLVQKLLLKNLYFLNSRNSHIAYFLINLGFANVKKIYYFFLKV